MTKAVERVIAGDVRTVARLIRDIDDRVPEVREILKALYAHTGHAYVVGITGAPGVGKSTLVDQMVAHLRQAEKTVGVLAVDPTSPFSGGAILGREADLYTVWGNLVSSRLGSSKIERKVNTAN